MFEVLLLALDDSETATKACEAAAQLAIMSGGEVRVVHVREYGFAGRAGQVEDEDRSAAQAIVDGAVARLAEAGIRASGVIRGAPFGHGAAEILDEAASVGATTIVMGSRGLNALEGLIIGSTTHKVLHLGRLPVLVVR
jgi:nucleotide-binding universal stress UspA family protein